MNGMILIPTLNRPHLLKRFLESFKATNANCAGYVLVDRVDLEKNLEAYEECKHMMGIDWIFRNTQDAVTMGDKVRFVWPELNKNMKWIGLLNDDHVLITPEWDKKIEKLIDGTNMVSTNDGNWNFGINVVGLTAWSTPLLEASGFPMFPDNIHHWYIDNIWKAIGESTGCWLETLTVDIEHRHVFCNKMEKDSTYEISQNPESAVKAREAYENFMKDKFKDVCMRIMALRSKQIQSAKHV